MYSCILKSDVVMNVTMFACVVGLLFMVKCVFVFGVGGWGWVQRIQHSGCSHITRVAF